MKVFWAADVGVIDRRSVCGPLRFTMIEVVFENGGDGGIGMGTNLQGPFAGRLQALRTVGFSQPENADAGAASPVRGGACCE